VLNNIRRLIRLRLQSSALWKEEICQLKVALKMISSFMKKIENNWLSFLINSEYFNLNFIIGQIDLCSFSKRIYCLCSCSKNNTLDQTVNVISYFLYIKYHFNLVSVSIFFFFAFLLNFKAKTQCTNTGKKFTNLKYSILRIVSYIHEGTKIGWKPMGFLKFQSRLIIFDCSAEKQNKSYGQAYLPKLKTLHRRFFPSQFYVTERNTIGIKAKSQGRRKCGL
jgi:hypothetical protein